MSKNKKKYYTVWEGREPGIYNSWEECKRQIHEFPEALYKGFENEKDARNAFLSPYWEYVGKNAKNTKPDIQALPESKRPICESISVDAACSGNPGFMEYRGVYTKTGEEIFRQGPFHHGTNNIGEFLAIVHGLALLKQKGSNLPIYSDSKIAQKWVNEKKCKTKLEQIESNKLIFDLIIRAEKWLLVNTYSTKVFKWDTVNWGEIPADFGRK